MNHRNYPIDQRDADIHTEHERYTLFVLGLACLFFAVAGGVAVLLNFLGP